MEAHSIAAQHVSLTNVAITLITYSVITILVSFWRAPRYPTSIPWAGHGKGWLAAISNTLGAFTHSQEWFKDGYSRYSKNDEAFVMPSSIGMNAEIVIPRSQMQWLLDQPDNIASTSAAHYDLLHGEYSFVKPIILQDPYHEHVVHKNLARNLNAMIPELNDEVCHDVDEFFGKDGQWKSFNLMNSFFKLVPKISNRMFVGEPLCRNKDYLSNMEGFTNDVIRGLFLFALFPKVLHPVVGAIASLAPKYHFWKTSKHSLPLINKRLADIKKKDAEDPEYKDWQEPNDFISWSIRTAMAEGRYDELDPTRIAMRIMPINFASIHTTAMTAHGVLLDILASERTVLEQLREEAKRIYHEEGNQWTKQGLTRMYRMDSAIRESQRYSAFAMTFVHRKILAKEGLTSPDGTHCEYGTVVSCPWIGVSNDDDIHGDADKYDAFRYSRGREAYEARAQQEKDSAEGLKLRQTGLVTTSDKHFPFGHGRHACPGRFFVSHELKMIFAHLILNYDLKNLEERPRPFWVGRQLVPPAGACIEVRRRTSS